MYNSIHPTSNNEICLISRDFRLQAGALSAKQADTILSHSNVLDKPGFKLVGVGSHRSAVIGKKMRRKAKAFRYLRC